MGVFVITGAFLRLLIAIFAGTAETIRWRHGAGELCGESVSEHAAMQHNTDGWRVGMVVVFGLPECHWC